MRQSRLSESRLSYNRLGRVRSLGNGGSGPTLPAAGNLIATVLDETSATLTVSVNKNAGDVFAVVINTTTGTIPPTAAQIIAGQDGSGATPAWDHNQGVGSTGLQTFAGGITGLIEGETYRAYAVFRDSNLAVSAVQETGDFIPADVTAPFISSLDLSEDGDDNWAGTVNTDTGEGLLDVVITTSATPPTAAQIAAGQSHTGDVAADALLNRAVTAAGVQNLTGNSALLATTSYWGHAIHADAAGNLSEVETTAASFTTDAGPTLSPPALASAPTVSGTPQVGFTLTGNDGTYTGNPTPAIGSYQWQRSNDGLTGWSNISGATSADYTAVVADETKYLRRSETATNSQGSLVSYTIASLQVAAGSVITGTIALTTPLKPRQAFQRDRANITLAGTYSLSEDPVAIEWRVDTSEWVQMASSTIGANAWSGTLDIPANYLAQGQLQIRPVNGPGAVATHDDVTVTDVFALLGDSMAAGLADNNDTYTKTNYDWLIFDGTSFNVTTHQTSIWPSLAAGLDAAGVPPVFIQYGSSGSAFRPDLGGSAGGSWHPNPTNGNTDYYYSTALTRLNAIDAGGFKALIWEQGPNDVIDANTFYEQNLKDLIDAYQLEAENFAGVQMVISLVGEVLAETTNLENLRAAQKRAIATDADILRGPSWIDLDFGDGVHFGKAPAGVAQQQLGGARWWRAIEHHFYGGSATPDGPTISTINVTGVREITVTFDRAVQNHADATGWAVEDTSGTVAVASAVQGSTSAQVILTTASDLRTNAGAGESILVSFGEAAQAVGSTLSDTETIAYPVEHSIDNDAGEAFAFNSVTPALDGTPTVGVAVTCDGGTWDSTSAITYAYQWRETAGGAAISGATSASYTPVTGDSAYLNTMVCDVTATNAKGAVTATSGTGAYSPATVFDGGKAGGWWRPDVVGDLFQDSTATTAVTADGDPVGCIADASGNGNPLKQATTAEQLTYDTDTPYDNVFGDGSNDGVLTDAFAADGDILMMVAADFSAATGTVLSFANANSTNGEFINIEHDLIRHTSNDFNGKATQPISPTGLSVVTVVATEADKTFRIYVNGVLVGAPTKAGSKWFDTTNTNKLTALARRVHPSFSDHSAGAIYQALVVVGANVADDRAALETYFGNTIGLSL